MSKTQARVLNMEEKRKLEKIIFADIDKAKNDYRSKSQVKRSEIEGEIEKSPVAVGLLKKWNDLKAQQEVLDKNLKASGFSIRSWSGEKASIYVSDSSKFSELRKSDNVDEKFENLKREYTLKLFASGEEAMEVFNALAKEIKAILG